MKQSTKDKRAKEAQKEIDEQLVKQLLILSQSIPTSHEVITKSFLSVTIVLVKMCDWETRKQCREIFNKEITKL